METASDVRTDNASFSAAEKRERAKPASIRIWNFLISVKLAIWIIIVLAVTSILAEVRKDSSDTDKENPA